MADLVEATKADRYEAQFMAEFREDVARCEARLQRARDRLAEGERRRAAGLCVIDLPR